MLRRILGSRLIGIQIATLLALGCGSVPPHPRIDSLEPGFSGRLARAHLESLEGLYPRLAGSHADTIARAYLSREFRGVGAEIRVLPEGSRHHLIAEQKGLSEDVVLLIAAYPVFESGVWIDDSGAALLLEFARVMGSKRLPYTLAFALAETRPLRIAPAQGPPGPEPGWRPILTLAAARGRLREAGRSLARGLEAEGEASRVRAVIVFDTSARPGLRVTRDLRSLPEFRRLFWESAAALGFGAMFPPDADWASPESLHLGFRERSMNRVLALVHVEAAREDPLVMRIPGEALPEMFDAIGAVSVEALTKLMRRFEKVDAFSR